MNLTFGMQVLTLDGNQIEDATTFLDPTVFSRFGLPLELGT